MAALTFILRYRKLLAAGAEAVIIAGLLFINYVQRASLDVCDMERAAMAQAAEQMRKNNEQAAKRILEQERQLRRREREVIREISDESNSAGVGAADFIGMLCNQGAAGCSTR